MELPDAFLPEPTGGATLGNAGAALVGMLRVAGYVDHAWFSLGGGHGFVLVTKLEQFYYRDGTPAKARFVDNPMLEFRGWRDVYDALFSVTPGRFRVIAFFVTDTAIKTGSAENIAEVPGLVNEGTINIPPSVSLRPYTSAHKAFALVYEFKKERNGVPAEFVPSSQLTAEGHLRGAGLLAIAPKRR